MIGKLSSKQGTQRGLQAGVAQNGLVQETSECGLGLGVAVGLYPNLSPDLIVWNSLHITRLPANGMK